MKREREQKRERAECGEGRERKSEEVKRSRTACETGVEAEEGVKNVTRGHKEEVVGKWERYGKEGMLEEVGRSKIGCKTGLETGWRGRGIRRNGDRRKGKEGV